MSSNIDKFMEATEPHETSHDRHLYILQNITVLAIDKAISDPNFDFDDAEETILTCETWVEGHGI